MKISYKWLCELSHVSWEVSEMAHRLTLAGVACSEIESLSERYQKIVIGRVNDLSVVAGADKLRLANVQIGGAELPIICGAPNIAVGQKVAVATVGATMPGGASIGAVTKFGVESRGMICSELELALGDDHSGVMILPADAEVGQSLIEYAGLDDYTMSFDLTPNRPDCLSAFGIARDLCALSGGALRRPEVSFPESEETTASLLRVRITDAVFNPRYSARIIRSVAVGESPLWLKARLIACGQRPINNVVDITNFVLLECGQPLHAFDLKYFVAGQVVMKRAQKGETFTTLDGVLRQVDESVLMITDGVEYLAAGGVMGGLKSSVTKETTDILLESAYFSPSHIRKSRRTLGLVTEASTRFEKGADPNGVVAASDRATQLLHRLAGGTPLAGVVDEYPAPILPVTIELRPSRVNDILGTEIATPEMVAALTGLEFTVAPAKTLKTTVPTFRPDIEREIDLIEEIARIVGYDRIPIGSRRAGVVGALLSPSRLEDGLLASVRRIMTGSGFDEVCGSGMADGRILTAMNSTRPLISIANPISDEFSHMSSSVIYSLLLAAKNNITHQVTAIRLFECGKGYGPFLGRDSLGGYFHERMQIGALVSGEEPKFWRGSAATLDFYWLKGAIENLLADVRIEGLKFAVTQRPEMLSGGAFEVTAGGKNIGFAGQISPDICKRFDIKQPVFACELDFNEILLLARPMKTASAIPRFPAAPRDLALVVDETVLSGDIVAVVTREGSAILDSARVFDVFRGKQIAAGKKSVAIAMNFRATDRSLESTEVDTTVSRIATALRESFAAEVRE